MIVTAKRQGWRARRCASGRVVVRRDRGHPAGKGDTGRPHRVGRASAAQDDVASVRCGRGCPVLSRILSLASSLALTQLTGCEVGPDHHRPALAVPGRYEEGTTAARTAATATTGGAAQALVAGADLPGDWWTLFRSPALSALVAQALRDNPNLEAARQALQAARELELEQKGTLFPTLSGQLLRGRQEIPLSDEGPPAPAELFTQYDAQLNLGYTLDVWGGLRRAIEQFGAQADYGRYELEAAVLSISAGVVISAIQAASLRGQIDVQAALIGFEQRQLDTVRRQFELGGATGTDVATQQAQVAEAQTVLVPLQTQLAQAHDQLAAYLGRAPSEVALPSITLDMLTLPGAVPVSLPSSLLEQRPDILAAEATLHAQTALLGVDIAQRLPQVTLTATVGSAAADVHQLFSPTNGLWSLVTQAAQPIFDAGQLLHRQRAQRAAMLQAAAQWRGIVVGAFQNVADVLAQLRNDTVNLRYAQSAAEAGQRGLSLASLQYRLGGASYLSVLTAEQTEQTAVITLIRAQAARYADTALLFQALGGGWWHRNDLPPAPPGLLSSPLP